MKIHLAKPASRLPGNSRDRGSQPKRLSGMAIYSVPMLTTPVLVSLEKASPGFGKVRGDCAVSRSSSRMPHASLSLVMGIRRPVPTPARVSGEQGTAAMATGRAMHLLSIVDLKRRPLVNLGSNSGKRPHRMDATGQYPLYIGAEEFTHDLSFMCVQ
jgi:hypothetical protein